MIVTLRRIMQQVSMATILDDAASTLVRQARQVVQIDACAMIEEYRDVLTTFAPLPVTLRTLDVGGDKVLA